MIRSANYYNKDQNKQLPCIQIDLGEVTKEQSIKLESIFKNTAFDLKVWSDFKDFSLKAAVMFSNEMGFKPEYINELLIGNLVRAATKDV